MEWYQIKNEEEIDSPALLLYPDRIKKNIDTLLSMIDDPTRLRPHVKTHKSIEVTHLMMEAGIEQFKCATIAEAEMLALAKVPDILLAYQPEGPKLKRLIALIRKYSASCFSCLTDNLDSAVNIAASAAAAGVEIPVYIDLNIGMNRTGIAPGQLAIDLYKTCATLKGIKPVGLHAYDGQFRQQDVAVRKTASDQAFEPVTDMQQVLTALGFEKPIIIAGGSPTFPIHAQRKEITCSPGTFIFWDKGYLDVLPEQGFIPAALVLSRVISTPDDSKICLDLGHKSIASENDLQKRVWFINAPELRFISQSEEHLVADAGAGHSYKAGDILYGIPIHICPTIALYESAITVVGHRATGEWKILARDRKITI